MTYPELKVGDILRSPGRREIKIDSFSKYSGKDYVQVIFTDNNEYSYVPWELDTLFTLCKYRIVPQKLFEGSIEFEIEI